MKYAHVYALFLVFVFYTSCGQKQTEPHKDNINYNIKDTVTSHGPPGQVRNIKQGRNGTILIASWKGIFRYDGKSFTNLTSKIGAHRFWDVLEDRQGNIWAASPYWRRYAAKECSVGVSVPMNNDYLLYSHFLLYL